MKRTTKCVALEGIRQPRSRRCGRKRRGYRADGPAKAANRYLKLAFNHAGIRAVQYYPEIRAFFKAKARKKPIRIARALVALELVRIVYHALTKQEDFNGQFKQRAR